MKALSVVIITFNEEANIGRCISSVNTIADEVIVLDSWSTDQTVAIARSYGATVYQEKFRGYIGQKNFAMQLATNDFILSLDADEALDETLVQSIALAKRSGDLVAYKMNRCTNYCGRFIRHGLWYPDPKIRLFDRRMARWGGLNPHDKIILDPPVPTRKLKGNILHYSFTTPDDLVWQNNRLSSISAASLYASGKKSNWFKILLRPAWAFFNGYILRRGFLDGADGFAIAVNTSYQVFLKYSKLYRLQQAKPKKAPPVIITPAVAEKKSVAGEG